MKKTVALITVLCMVCFVGSAFAQEDFTGGPAAGKKELALSGSINMGDDTTYSAYGHYGVFRTKEQQLGLSGLFFAGDNDTSVMLGGFFKYYFVGDVPKQQVPYVGLEISKWISGDVTDTLDEMYYGGSLGWKNFIDENTSFFIEYKYQDYSDDEVQTDPQENIFFGFSRFFD